MREYDLHYHFDENLHEVPESPTEMELYIQDQKIALNTVQSPVERVRILGEIGTYLRILGDLVEAKDYLEKAQEVIHRHGLDNKLEVQNQIRLAHTYQWLCEFEKSNELFQDLLNRINEPTVATYADFIWQHAGKNYFDQMKWSQAYNCFEKALELRLQRKALRDQIDSSREASRAALQRMN